MHLTTPFELKKRFPISSKSKAFIAQSRKTIISIFEKKDPRHLMIVGPCSIHNVEEALIYAKELKRFLSKVQDFCFLVMRAYVEKPRTRQGWKGFIFDPYLDGSNDMQKGLELSRFFLLQLAELEIPTATEFLTPHVAPYIEDLISWGCIGARTSTSQTHRLLASHLSMPLGFKNSIDGNIDSAIDGIHVARTPHAFLHIGEQGKLFQVQSQGNLHTHIVLRGSHLESNFDKESIQETLFALRKEELLPRILIDCSHDNARGHYFKQKEAFQSVLEQIREGNNGIMGMMLESYLEAGSQKIPPLLCDLQKGVSVTDSCLDFSSTEELILSLSSSKSMSFTQS